MNPIKIILILCAAALVSSLSFSRQSGSPSPESEFWSDAENVRRFLGSYGFQSQKEPSINREEQNVLREVSAVIADDLNAAAQLLESRIRPDSSGALDFVLGNLRFQLNELGAAERHYRTAIRKFPDFMRAHRNLGLIHVRMDDFERAVASLTRTLELGGTGGELYGLIGFSHMNLERHHSAESAYRQAILFEPGNVEWKQGMARSLLIQEKFREARVLFDELITEHPERGDFYLHQANIFLALEQPRSAAVNYEMVRRLRQATENSLINLGDIYLNENILDLAGEVYLEALENAGEALLPRYLRAAAAFANRRAWEEASELLAKVQERDLNELNFIEVKKISARIKLGTGNEQQAVETLEEILSVNPLDGQVLILLGEYYGKNGEPERAELYFERATRQHIFEAEARLRHAELLVNQNRLERAADLLRRAQEVTPSQRVGEYLNRVEQALEAQAR